MKRWLALVLFACAALACSRSDVVRVETPSQDAKYKSKETHRRSKATMEVEKPSSNFEACMARLDGMQKERARFLCEQQMIAATPDPTHRDPPPRYYYGYGY